MFESTTDRLACNETKQKDFVGKTLKSKRWKCLNPLTKFWQIIWNKMNLIENCSKVYGKQREEK